MGILTMETGCLQIINQELLLLPVLRQLWLHMVFSVHLDALAQPLLWSPSSLRRDLFLKAYFTVHKCCLLLCVFQKDLSKNLQILPRVYYYFSTVSVSVRSFYLANYSLNRVGDGEVWSLLVREEWSKASLPTMTTLRTKNNIFCYHCPLCLWPAEQQYWYLFSHTTLFSKILVTIASAVCCQWAYLAGEPPWDNTGCLFMWSPSDFSTEESS